MVTWIFCIHNCLRPVKFIFGTVLSTVQTERYVKSIEWRQIRMARSVKQHNSLKLIICFYLLWKSHECSAVLSVGFECVSVNWRRQWTLHPPVTAVAIDTLVFESRRRTTDTKHSCAHAVAGSYLCSAFREQMRLWLQWQSGGGQTGTAASAYNWNGMRTQIPKWTRVKNSSR